MSFRATVALALLGAMTACATGTSDVEGGPGGRGGVGGEPGIGGAGGTSGSAGAGPLGAACATPADLATLLELRYRGGGGRARFGAQAFAEMSRQCFWAEPNSLEVPGCNQELSELLADGGPDELLAFSDCLSRCVGQMVPALSTPCADCFASRLVCEIEFCVVPCATIGCEECLCENQCPQSFEECSGVFDVVDCSEL